MKFLIFVVFVFFSFSMSLFGQVRSTNRIKTSEGTIYWDFKGIDSIVKATSKIAGDKPFVILNNNIFLAENLETLDAKEIAFVEAYDKSKSSSWYGGRGVNGVLKIQTKKYVNDETDRLASKYRSVLQNDNVPVPYDTESNATARNVVHPFTTMETPPTYPGKESFDQFVEKNLIYPTEAKTKNIQGNVNLSFIINENGSISDIKLARKLGYGLDEEAIRIIKLSKRWNPGILNGKPVKVSHNMLIRFKLK